jgi:predicted Zn-dependent protease
MENRLDEARENLTSALLLKPSLPRVHELLGRIALFQGRNRDAVTELERERALHGITPGLELLRGQAYARLGDRARAGAAYQRELDRFPGNAEARDSLAASAARP